MPEISRFFGLVVTMHYDDHPPPHFHARSGDQAGIFAIDPPSMLTGNLSARLSTYAVDWARRYQAELLENWERSRHNQPLKRIAPLT